MTVRRCFVDTNVFAYALDSDEGERRHRAMALIGELRREIVISTQVLLELSAVCTRKLGMSRQDARRVVSSLAGFPVVTTDRDTILDAVALSETEQISVFDAAIVCAAQRAECTILFSEDLNGGQKFDSLVVENPFA